jgi:hypothetical protein
MIACTKYKIGTFMIGNRMLLTDNNDGAYDKKHQEWQFPQ